MPLTRRRFSVSLLGSAAGGIVPGAVAAQNAPAEGVNYVRIAPPAPTAVPGKIEVIEFFWYECPHCNAFEPALDAWVKRAPDDVAFRRVPVWFREEPFGPQQRLFYTLDALGLVATLHRKVFSTIHGDRTRMRTPEDFAAFALGNGVDPIRFMAAYGSFSVQSKAEQARQTAAAYKVDAVPTMGIQGRYSTNGNLASAGVAAGSNDRMLAVVDAVVARVRQGSRG
jgi:thiol:disulfide interchange protein DsbA